MMIVRKNVIVVSLAILCLVLTLFSAMVKVKGPVQEDETPTIMLAPQSQTVFLGDTIRVDCWMEDVTNLYGYRIEITWNPTIIKHSSHVVIIPRQMWQDAILYAPYQIIADIVDETANISGSASGTMYQLWATSLEGAPSYNGTGRPFVIFFNAAAIGTTWINFTYTALTDPQGNGISNTSENAVVHVINPPPEISLVYFNGTSPYPYQHAAFIRPNEPVLVTANITYWENPLTTQFSYRLNGGSWWNTTMSYNYTSRLWQIAIPGQLGGSTIEFFIIANDVRGYSTTSSTYSFQVRPLLMGDVNGDGKVDILDVVLITGHYGDRYP